MENKVCVKCGIDKPLMDYRLNRRGRYAKQYGYRDICKSCDRRERYAIPSRDKNRAIWKSLKESIGCQLCGESCWVCLDWHHVDRTTKSMNTYLSNTVGTKRLLSELQKCTLVCSNCHHKINHGVLVSPEPLVDLTWEGLRNE